MAKHRTLIRITNSSKQYTTLERAKDYVTRGRARFVSDDAIEFLAHALITTPPAELDTWAHGSKWHWYCGQSVGYSVMMAQRVSK